MTRKIIHADAIADYRGNLASPGAILLDGDSIVCAGTPEEIGRPAGVEITQVNGLVTPSFVNVHTHLDLSGVGTKPACDSFGDWVVDVVAPIRRDTKGVSDAVNRGLELVHVGGTAIVGDISGSSASSALTCGIKHVSTFHELIESSKTVEEVARAIHQLPANCGVSPHAPYTCSVETFAASFESNRLVATHLCETLEELEYAKTRTGAIAELEKRLGVWDDKKKPWGKHPLEVALTLAQGKPFIGVHLNYIEDRHLPMLAQSTMTVAYCPRASEYFGHVHHRWEDMVEAGVQIALGTDSLLCLDTPERISVLDEMRLLFQRDNADATLLLTMATVNGARALGVDRSLVTLDEGKTAGLLAFTGCDSLTSLLSVSTSPRWVYVP
jgi:aminodeoxyfutalosine deaminase